MKREQTPMPFELLEVPGVTNVRDLGGYLGEGGRTTKPRQFLRSASLSAVGEDGALALERLGVRRIVDLRSTVEVQRSPTPLHGDPRFVIKHVPMLDYLNSSVAAGDYTQFPANMEEMYRGLLDHAGASFREVLELMAAERDGACLFHCTAGKDRTGVTAMLLLSLAGVDEETIVEDYRWSERLYGWDGVSEWREFPDDEEGDVFSMFVRSAPATMRAALDHLRSAYGGVRQYLVHAGVSRETMDILRDRLLGM